MLPWSRQAILVAFGLLLAANPLLAQGPSPLPRTGVADPHCAPLDELMEAFVRDQHIPGASLAVARKGRLVYARGFGHADVASRVPVQPDSRFRIASVSKPFTSAAIMLLVEQGKLSLEARPFTMPGVMPALPADRKPDERLAKITVRNLLSHAGGFDRGKSGDPMFMSRRIATELKIPSPPGPADIMRWVAMRPLDFDPGTKSVYSNVGYCVLGRVIEAVSGESYEHFVRSHLLEPQGITGIQLGRTLESGRLDGEVRYYGQDGWTGPSVFDASPGNVTAPYGGWCLEAMDANGGWVASAPDLVRFATALGQPGSILKAGTLETLWSRPAHPRSWAAFWEGGYYAFGWYVDPDGERTRQWHRGIIAGTSALLVRRQDGLTWAVLFNTDQGRPAHQIAKKLHKAMDRITSWPQGERLLTPAPGSD